MKCWILWYFIWVFWLLIYLRKQYRPWWNVEFCGISSGSSDDYFTLENSTDPDEMLNFVVFHLGLLTIILPKKTVQTLMKCWILWYFIWVFWRLFYLRKQYRPWWNVEFCGISSGSSDDYSTLENSTDPNELLNFVVFHLGLHSFSKYLCFQYSKG